MLKEPNLWIWRSNNIFTITHFWVEALILSKSFHFPESILSSMLIPSSSKWSYLFRYRLELNNDFTFILKKAVLGVSFWVWATRSIVRGSLDNFHQEDWSFVSMSQSYTHFFSTVIRRRRQSRSWANSINICSVMATMFLLKIQ